MSNVLDCILTRRTTHEYLTEPIPEGALERAIAAAAAAPNHRMTEPWRFRRVGSVTRGRMLEIYLDLKTAKSGELADDKRGALIRKFMNPAEMLVISRVRHDDHAIAREDYAAVSCAAQNLMLSLHAEGVGSKWTTGAVTRDDRTYDALGIDFDTERIEGFIWVGIAANGAKPIRQRSSAEILTELP